MRSTVFDLPEEILATLQTRAQNANTPVLPDEEPEPVSNSSDRALNHEEPKSATAKATSCALCVLSFPDLQEQRSHVRSDLHGYNLKRKIRELGPVSEAEFESLIGGRNANHHIPDREAERR
jgi:hypothetical protein